MRNSFKTISLLMSLLLVIGAFAACSGEKTVNTGDKYTYWAAMDSVVGQTHTSYSELLMYQEMTRATGTEIEFIHPAAGSTGTEAFQILLSSGDYPDMIEYSWASYAGGPDSAINDGVIISLNKYMKDYAPNYYDYMEGEKGKANGYLYKAQSLTDAGNYFGFRNMNIGSYRAFSGLYVRKDMLDKWELDVPVTIDDWTNLFKTAKENGFKYPLTGNNNMFKFGGNQTFNTAWNVGKGWYVDNDKVKFGPFETAYKDYLKQMAEWSKSGYIDPDYVTNATANIEGYMTNGTSVATFGFVGSGLGRLLPAMEERDPNYKLAACPHPVLNKGETPAFQDVQPEAKDATIAVTVQCGIDNEDRYKEAVKWCDYLYSDEGMVLKSFGVENDTFTIETDENGEKHYVYTDKIYNHEEIGAHSVEAALYHFFRPANGPGLNQHPDYLNGFYPYEEQKEAIVLWNTYIEEAKKHSLPPLSYTGEEAAKKANAESACNDNLNAVISNIILGKASIDTYDAAIEKAKKDGYGELLKIQQAAYDRYLALIK